MKISICKLLMVGVSLIALSVLSLAQDSSYQVKVKVPFDFYAAGQQLPAGNYLFSVNYETHAVTLRNRETGHSYSLIAIPDDGDRAGQSYVEFATTGGAYRLADVKTANSGISFLQANTTVSTAQMRKVPAVVASLR